MKTIEELIEDLLQAAYMDGEEEGHYNGSKDIRDELKRRVRDLELIVWATSNRYSASLEKDLGYWLWIGPVTRTAITGHEDGADSWYIPKTGLIPELNDELRERLEREWKEAGL